jgi:1-aminocyclopropane-1-carboxylate deaminase/D-cysteine desulfhydrase-like pyridoxal-dependent ACC family enzyme
VAGVAVPTGDAPDRRRAAADDGHAELREASGRPLVDLGGRDTPLQAADRLGAALGLPAGALWVKRDDLTGLAAGGNKVRKLERLCADALAQGCDTIVSGGANQSNHVRLTAAACAHLGLRCVAVLPGTPPTHGEGNLALDLLLGAELCWVGGRDLEQAIEDEAGARRAEGARTYAAPLGGSSPVGALGYVTCADELGTEAPPDALVVCADGSGGTHAGLVAGFGDHGRVLGVNVGFADLVPRVPTLAAATAALAARPPPAGTVQLDDGQPEPYGQPTDATREALELAARTEGLLLDPVYTGRALAALVAGVRRGHLGRDRPLVLLHTGGLPALFTARYAGWFGLAGAPGSRST